MADEKDPRREPSKPHDDEASNDQATHDDDATPTADTADDDHETRMLEQLAALRGGASSDDTPDASAPDEESPQPPQEPDAQPETTHEPVDTTEHKLPDRDATETDEAPATQRTAVLSPVAAEATEEPKRPGSSVTAAPPKQRRRWPWIVGALIILFGVGYVGLAYATQDTLPATLTIEGVDVSGMSVDEAAPVLEDEFASRAEREVTITVDEADAQASIVPAEAGYSYDVEATLNELTDLTFNPVALGSRLFGEAHVSAGTNVDEQAVSEAVAGVDEQLSFEPTEGAVAFEAAEVNYTQPVTGFALNAEALADQLDKQWLTQTDRIAAPGEVTEPAISAEEWEQFVTDTAQPLVADNFTVTAGDTTTQLTPAQLGAAAEVVTDTASEAARGAGADETTNDTDESEAEPRLVLDADALTEALENNNPAFASTHQDATVQLTGSAGSGEPEVVPGSSGRGVDGDEVVDEILADLTGEQSRTISVELQEIEPEITTEDAEAWDVDHVDAKYATPYPPEDETRTDNLRVGAQRVNGTVVMPGEEFNLNSILAPVTEANGYHQSGVVESGVTTTAVGGGLSQIATMAYNAGFLGGMEIVEYKPHSRWFDRYPMGRESTYWEGQINVRWKNDTDAPVIVEMWLADDKVHTRLWGSDYYDVETTTSEPYNRTASPTIRSDDEECVPERGGKEGFTVDVQRTKTPPNGEAITESWSWAYSGWPTVICE